MNDVRPGDMFVTNEKRTWSWEHPDPAVSNMPGEIFNSGAIAVVISTEPTRPCRKVYRHDFVYALIEGKFGYVARSYIKVVARVY